ncbi:hypothetical protein IHQ60_RS24565, partial [Escherichia coli]
YMDIDTTAKYKSGVTTVKDSVRLVNFSKHRAAM